MKRKNNQYYGKVELFRYSIIVPLINGTSECKTIQEFCKKASEKTYEFDGNYYKFSERTIKSWYYNYQKNGLDSLCKHQRKDKNDLRKIKNENVVDRIIELRKQYPRITTKAIYAKLKEENYVDETISIHCLFRYLKSNNLKATEISRKEKKKYEQAYPNDCWQSDTSTGPYIIINDKKCKTYLISVIDDMSRVIVSYGFFTSDNAINMQKVLKEGIKKYGIPKKLYVDNGSPYKNEQLSIITSRLGIELIHAKPYSPTGKGKVERSFRTIKDGWMNCTDWNSFKSVDDIEKSFSEFLYNEYLNKVHSELKETPNNRYHKYIDKIKRVKKEEVEKAFMHTKICKVYNNSTIQLNKQIYEVPYKYVGQKIEVRYYVDNEEEIWIYKDNEKKEQCQKPKLNDNAKSKRKDNIDYAKMINKEEEV